MKRIKLTEDWTANLVGFLMVGLVLLLCAPWAMELFGWDAATKLKGQLWPSFSWSTWGELGGRLASASNWARVAGVFLAYGVFAAVAGWVSGKPVRRMLAVYPAVFLLTVVASFIAGNSFLKAWGGETVVFCLLVGLAVGNAVKLPDWFRENITSELFVKTGLVLLGTTILFRSMMQAGVFGLAQAVIVIGLVWNFCYWLCRRMGVDREMGLMMSSGVSICGVSAAIATSGAIKGDKTKLSYVISLVMVCAVPMIILLPLVARWLGFSEPLAGAWFGGTIDTTGAVAASGAFYGEVAEQICMIVKSSQNVLLGIAAFLISIYWTVTNNKRTKTVSAGVIWERFPKFVLGFVLASLLFSFLVPDQTVKFSKEIIKSAQSFWFALAFVSIGLETNFKALVSRQNRRATGAFLLAQLFNIAVTLVVAWLLFDVLGGGDAFMN